MPSHTLNKGPIVHGMIILILLFVLNQIETQAALVQNSVHNKQVNNRNTEPSSNQEALIISPEPNQPLDIDTNLLTFELNSTDKNAIQLSEKLESLLIMVETVQKIQPFAFVDAVDEEKEELEVEDINEYIESESSKLRVSLPTFTALMDTDYTSSSVKTESGLKIVMTLNESGYSQIVPYVKVGRNRNKLLLAIMNKLIENERARTRFFISLYRNNKEDMNCETDRGTHTCSKVYEFSEHLSFIINIKVLGLQLVHQIVMPDIDLDPRELRKLSIEPDVQFDSPIEDRTHSHNSQGHRINRHGCFRSICGAMVTIVSFKKMRRQVIKSALQKLSTKPSFAKVFNADVKTWKIKKDKDGKSVIVFIPLAHSEPF